MSAGDFKQRERAAGRKAVGRPNGRVPGVPDAEALSWATLTWPTSSAAFEPASTARTYASPAPASSHALREPSPMLVEAQLMACAEACRICATECESHAANA